MKDKSLIIIGAVLILVLGGIWAFYYYVSTINKTSVQPTVTITPVPTKVDPKLAINEGITDLVTESINNFCSPTSIRANKIELEGSNIKITGTNNQVYTVTYSENSPLIRLIRSVRQESYVDIQVLTPKDIPSITNETEVCIELVSLSTKINFNFSDIKEIIIY